MNKDKVIGALIVLVILMGVALYGSSMNVKTAKVEDAKSAPDVASVATVNGMAIPAAAFESQLAKAIATASSRGVDVQNADKLSQIKTQVLNSFISNELVTQGAKKSGLVITPDEVEKQLQTIVTQAGGADKFAAQLAASNLTEAQLRDNISKQLMVQKYLQQNVDVGSVSVSDAEIAKFYADNSKGQKNVPSLKTVSAQIKQQIMLDKEQALIAAFVDMLRSKAQITTSK